MQELQPCCFKRLARIKTRRIFRSNDTGSHIRTEIYCQKERPDRSDNHSFPSMHTSTSFAAAAFIQRRYGWKWGLPSYILSTYVGWTRVYGKKHDWWDVAAGAAIGARKFLHLHPPVCQEAQPDNQPCCRRRTLRVLCIHELLKETAAESTAILIKNPLLKNSREDLLYY